jgi:hypothetical protein
LSDAGSNPLVPASAGVATRDVHASIEPIGNAPAGHSSRLTILRLVARATRARRTRSSSAPPAARRRRFTGTIDGQLPDREPVPGPD